MPTDSSGRAQPAASFVLRALAWGLGIFGLLKLGWFETRCLLPVTRLQARLGTALCGAPAGPIEATLACSGADAIALCLAAILAYPASWRARLAGAGGGLALILGLNALRIGTLGRAAASPRLFEALHVYLWPALLTAAIACYVFVWMRLAGPRPGAAATGLPARRERPAWGPAGRFIVLTLVFLGAFVAASPLYLDSRFLLSVAVLAARFAAAILRSVGLDAVASANVLVTSRGSFLVTQECLCTPLIPVYLAAVAAHCRAWRRGALAVVAAAPLFFGLGVARLLVVALPGALVGSPPLAIHAFSQLLLAAVVVFLAAARTHGAGWPALRRSLLGILGGLLAARLLGPHLALLANGSAEAVAGLLSAAAGAAGLLDDPQGAIALLPPFQLGFYLALWVAAFAHLGRGRHATGLALLGLGQVAALAGLHLLHGAGIAPHVRDVRAWAVAAPLLVLALLSRGRWPGSTSRAPQPDDGAGHG